MDTNLPTFSVIIPTYSRPKKLAKCLRAFAALRYPRNRFEVIVVDDGGNIALEPIMTPLRRELNLILVEQANTGPASARNNGAAHARGEYLAFTDDDCAPAPDWLRRLASCLVCDPDRAVGGHTVTALPHNPFSAASQILIDYLYSYYNANPLSARFFTSNNLALSAAHFRTVGGFNTTMPMAAGEDREFCDRWLYHGFAMTLVPEAVVYHAHRLTLLSFWKQHFRYGRGARLFHLASSQRRAEGIQLEPLSFYLNLLGYPLNKARNGRALLLTLFLLLSQWANATGFIWQQLAETKEAKTKRPSMRGSAL